MFNLSACFVNEHIDKGEIKELSDNFIELFVQKNAEELFNCFCYDIRENRKDETIEEMQKAFDFIDGNIIDYEFNSFGSEEEKKSSGQIYYYECNPNYKNVLTDNGKNIQYVLLIVLIIRKTRNMKDCGELRSEIMMIT